MARLTPSNNNNSNFNDIIQDCVRARGAGQRKLQRLQGGGKIRSWLLFPLSSDAPSHKKRKKGVQADGRRVHQGPGEDCDPLDAAGGRRSWSRRAAGAFCISTRWGTSPYCPCYSRFPYKSENSLLDAGHVAAPIPGFGSNGLWYLAFRAIWSLPEPCGLCGRNETTSQCFLEEC